MEFVYRPVVGFARAVFLLEGLKFTIEGAQNVPRTGGAIMAINHLSYMDFTYAGLAARPSGRVVRFMAKKSIFEHRITGPLMRGMKHIPVDRHAGAASFRTGVNALKGGEIVGIFPEATMSLSFEIKEFKSGTVRMAQAAGVPVLPTTLWGAQRVWTKGHPKRLGRTNIPIFVRVGEPLTIAKGDDSEAASAELRRRMIAQLDDQISRYPTMPESDLVYLPARFGGTAPTPAAAAEKEAADMRRTVDKFNEGRQ